ncbi:MAG TPA: hypothetical protein VHD84_00585 [Candidatus Saccharimonadales bacterium]|nr:hypothetical protein [Candidatus Saccharimonadales bacterium]
MKLWKVGILSLLLAILLPWVVRADDVVQSFTSTQKLQPGMIVALDSTNSKAVQAATAANVSAIYGVVVNPSDAPLTLTGQSGQVYVTTSGTYQVLVSAAAGAIKTGDYISISSLNGIGAKASGDQPTVVGQAEGGFDGHTGTVTTSNGTAIGRIEVNISVQHNPLAGNNAPTFLRRTANSLANKSVSTARIYTALAILLITAGAAVTILWSGIRSSLISLGRNPLSRHTILGGMYKVILVGIGIFALGLAGVYLVLKI